MWVFKSEIRNLKSEVYSWLRFPSRIIIGLLNSFSGLLINCPKNVWHLSARRSNLLSVIAPYPLLCVLILNSCSQRERSNPLDPKNPFTSGVESTFRAIAGNQKVTLLWDVGKRDDVSGFEIFRKERDQKEFKKISGNLIPSSINVFEDNSVANGLLYSYQLGIALKNKIGVRLSKIVDAQPGPEICWISDYWGYRIQQITPDSRYILRSFNIVSPSSIAFNPINMAIWVVTDEGTTVQKITPNGKVILKLEGFLAITDLQLDIRDNSCWVADSLAQAVVKIPYDGNIPTVIKSVNGLPLLNPKNIAIDSKHGWCWIAEPRVGRVIRYSTIGGPSLMYDSLGSPDLVSADETSAACWIADMEALRIIRIGLEGPKIISDRDFEGIVSIEADPSSHGLWVATDLGLSRIGTDGSVKLTLSGIRDILAIAVNRLDGSVWVTKSNKPEVIKISAGGDILGRLEGFAWPSHIFVDPGE